MNKRLVPVLVTLIVAAGLLVGFVPEDAPQAAYQDETGTLEFYANGEDFVRQGFVSKDGWAITFDELYINLAGITAYQTDPPYDPHEEDAIEAEVSAGLEGSFLVDLAEGDEEADPLLVGAVDDAPAGRYNAVSWQMVNLEEGNYEGYTLVMIGTAEKDEETVAFTLMIETEYEYMCGEYVGDERKGILEAGDMADLEMTFHFDHIFGDGELPLDDGLNEAAPGFAMFAALAEDGALEADMAALEEALAPADYEMLVEILPTLGHVGEGHCHEVSMQMEAEEEAG
jgi:hypothetical protein